MTNREIAQRFAKGATKGITGNRTIYIEGDVIYSYGAHWPMAFRKGNQAFVNGDKYSATTSKQTCYVASQLSYAGFEITDVGKEELRRLIEAN